MIAAHCPSDVERRCEAGLILLLGLPVVSAHWQRLSPSMRTWLSKLCFFLPAMPWGHVGAGMLSGEG